MSTRLLVRTLPAAVGRKPLDCTMPILDYGADLGDDTGKTALVSCEKYNVRTACRADVEVKDNLNCLSLKGLLDAYDASNHW